MNLWGEPLSFADGFFLLLALALALGFEFVNGFHDTANAVATVIYTNTLKPVVAVIWSGCWNLIGVLLSTGTVAYSIVALLPVELVLHAGSAAGFAMIFSLLVSAILWNLGTWFFGLPASSTHTLTGAIIGVGMANAMVHGHTWQSGINWGKAYDIGLALVVSPLVGFFGAGLLLLLAKLLIRRKDLYQAPPDKETPPPLWIRLLLILTCTGVSYSHGSNDGQKGMGLLMLILVGLVPGAFALNMETTPVDSQKAIVEMRQVAQILAPQAKGQTLNHDEASKELMAYLPSSGPKANEATFAALVAESNFVADTLTNFPNMQAVPHDQRTSLRADIYLVDESIGKVLKAKAVSDPATVASLTKTKTQLNGIIEYIPLWVKVAVALALGFGTMIGWKRIVVTVGEKIGKAHLTYAQGASAEIVAWMTIQAADKFGLPVSTTHVLSSGIAGTMAANGSGLQTKTLVNILMAWVLTLPVCIFLGASLFSAGLYLTLHVFGSH